MPTLQDLLDQSRPTIIDRYNQLRPDGPLGTINHDTWVTTSGNPCVYCREMARISSQLNVPVGGRFPGPNLLTTRAFAQLGLTMVNEPGEAHDNCQCQRVTVGTQVP